jgi:GntR family transcriptional repressor for pyruvate dehydrogenase complex
VRTAQIAGVSARAVEDHRAIVQALKARDPEAARLAMVSHLDHVEQSLRDIAAFESSSSEPETTDSDVSSPPSPS